MKKVTISSITLFTICLLITSCNNVKRNESSTLDSVFNQDDSAKSEIEKMEQISFVNSTNFDNYKPENPLTFNKTTILKNYSTY